MHNTFQNISDANLVSFLNHSKELEKKFGIDRYEFDKTWIQIKYHIASSASHMYSFLRTLIIATNMKSDEARYYFFYIDMILGKLSSTVFTETPKTSQLDILSRNAKEIAIIGENLLFVAKNHFQSTQEDEYKRYFDTHFQRLFVKIFTLFDFSYSGKEGIFTRFTLNKKLFLRNKSYFNALETDMENISDIPLFLRQSLVNNIHNTITEENDENDEITNKNISPNHLKTYASFIHKNGKDLFPVEVFSYILSTKLWKFTKYLHDMPEYINTSEKNEIIKKFNSSIVKYSKDNLKIIQLFYTKELTNLDYFLKVSVIDKEFMANTIFKDILVPYTVTQNNNEKRTEIPERNSSSLWNDFNEGEHPKLSKLINYMIENKKDEKFKYYRIFEKGTFEEIALSIDYLYNDITNHVDKEKLKYSHFLGLLRSGSFLAHGLTIINYYALESRYQTSSSILTYPYISLVPLEIYNRENDNERHIIYIDEAVKSQFSLSIADTYRKRILHLHDTKNTAIKDREDAFSLVNFKQYLEMTIDINPKIHSSINIDIITDVKKSIISVGEKINKYLPKEVFNWKHFLKNLNIIDTDWIETIYNISLIENNRLDFTKAIKHSFLLFKIAKYFATELDNLVKDKYEKIVFFHGCSEAKILTDTISFVYKSLNTNHVKLNLDSRQVDSDTLNNNKTLRLFIDLTIDSGSTKEETKSYYLTERSNVNNSIDFQHTFVIATRKEYQDITHLTLFNPLKEDPK